MHPKYIKNDCTLWHLTSLTRNRIFFFLRTCFRLFSADPTKGLAINEVAKKTFLEFKIQLAHNIKILKIKFKKKNDS